ncbi:Ankyrin repeat [Diplonema papillatum]|nr:Ankyrin repeat [Diplonema papillatum]
MADECTDSPEELPPIHLAIKENDIEAVKNLIDEGFVNQRTRCRKAPLMTAGYYCRKEMLPLLIDAGAVVNAIDETTGNTAAHYVVMSMSGYVKQCSCMMVLSQCAARIDIVNYDGLTVTALADKNGNTDIAATYDAIAN